MKYCSKCGSEILDEVVICPNCGLEIQEISKKHNNGLGITALVLSIIGFWTGWLGIGVLLDVLAIILGVFAIVKAKKSNANKGFSIAGVITATVSLIMMLVLFILPSSTPNYDIKINKPIVSSEGVEITFTSIKNDAVFSPSRDLISTFELEVLAVNNTGHEDELYNVETSMDLYGPDGTEVDTSISGPGYVMTGYIAKNDNQYKEGKVLNGVSKAYTIAFPDPGEDGEYTLIYRMDFKDYKLHFKVEHLDKEAGGTTITYPTEDGEKIYQAWPTK